MRQIISRCLVILLSWHVSASLYGQIDPGALESALRRVVEKSRATVGCAVLIDDGVVATLNDNVHYPLMSVFKFHVALAVLNKMEQCQIPVDTILKVKSTQLHTNTYSPLRDKFPNQDIAISIEKLLYYSVAESDNNACDILIDFVGGIEQVNTYIRETGLSSGCQLAETEDSMHADLMRCYNNYSTPSSMVRLLSCFDGGKLLSEKHTTLLRNIMLSTSTGKDKIKSGLPDQVKLAHKTGSSDRLASGAKIGDNDAGIIYMPDGRRCYLSVFVKDSFESDAANAALIADITHTIYTMVSVGAASEAIK